MISKNASHEEQLGAQRKLARYRTTYWIGNSKGIYIKVRYSI
jgi:hypothetical protein